MNLNIKIVELEDIREIIESISEKLKKVGAEAYIIGSVAEGSAVCGESDLDLLIISGSEEDWYEYLQDEFFLLLEKGLVLHIIVAVNESYEKLLEVARRKGMKI